MQYHMLQVSNYQLQFISGKSSFVNAVLYL